MKPPSAPPLLVPSALLLTISLLSGSSIIPANYEMFNDSEELSKSDRVALQQPLSSCLMIQPSRNNQPPSTAPCT